MRILIAEDSALTRSILRYAVEGGGHECLVAHDGTEAWRLFQESGADVVISDWMMPGIEGPDLCRRVREYAGEAYTYFILLTALEDKQYARQGMDAGADDYLTKPLDLDELGLRLTAAVRVTALHRELAALHRMQGRLDGVRLTGRELAHLLNNDLAPVVGALELVQERLELPTYLRALVDDAAASLDRAVQHVAQLQQVVQVEVKDTIAGPALDLERSTSPASDDTLEL